MPNKAKIRVVLLYRPLHAHGGLARIFLLLSVKLALFKVLVV